MRTKADGLERTERCRRNASATVQAEHVTIVLNLASLARPSLVTPAERSLLHVFESYRTIAVATITVTPIRLLGWFLTQRTHPTGRAMALGLALGRHDTRAAVDAVVVTAQNSRELVAQTSDESWRAAADEFTIFSRQTDAAVLTLASVGLAAGTRVAGRTFANQLLRAAQTSPCVLTVILAVVLVTHLACISGRTGTLWNAVRVEGALAARAVLVALTALAVDTEMAGRTVATRWNGRTVPLTRATVAAFVVHATLAMGAGEIRRASAASSGTSLSNVASTSVLAERLADVGRNLATISGPLRRTATLERRLLTRNDLRQEVRVTEPSILAVFRTPISFASFAVVGILTDARLAPLGTEDARATVQTDQIADAHLGSGMTDARDLAVGGRRIRGKKTVGTDARITSQSTMDAETSLSTDVGGARRRQVPTVLILLDDDHVGGSVQALNQRGDVAQTELVHLEDVIAVIGRHVEVVFEHFDSIRFVLV